MLGGSIFGSDPDGTKRMEHFDPQLFDVLSAGGLPFVLAVAAALALQLARKIAADLCATIPRALDIAERLQREGIRLRIEIADPDEEDSR